MLHPDGVGLMTSYGDKWLGDAAFARCGKSEPAEGGGTHPHSPDCFANLKVGVADIEWTTDTTRTIASLLFSGTAARYPDIRWIFSHGGGTMPFLLSRFQYEKRRRKRSRHCCHTG